MFTAWRQWVGIGVGALLLLGAAWLWGPVVWGRVIETALKDRVAKYEKETEAAKQEVAQATQEKTAAKAEAARAKANADRFASQAKQLGAERDQLLARVRSAAAELEQIRADVAKVPVAELLGRIRRALAQLRGSGPGG